MKVRQKVTPFLCYNDQAVEAANFYVSLIKNSQIKVITPGPTGSPMMVEFSLGGVDFLALNGGPRFQFTEAVSLSVDCETQAEIDELWEKLSEGGKKLSCGWVKDRWGLCWQIVPSIIPDLIRDPVKGVKVLEAVWQMEKLDIAKLQATYDEA